jgi:fatty-acid desaturase
MKQALKDPAVEFFSRWYVYIAVNLSVLLLVGIADWHLIFTGIGLGYLLEQVRLATINAYTHTPGLPGNYRNFDTKDNSHNNWILMLPTLGFSLHNNHHAEAGKMVMRNKWWEVDIEGYFCYILSLTAKSQKL